MWSTLLCFNAETCEDIEESLTEINSCMKLLLPDPDNFDMCNLEPRADSNGVSTSLESGGRSNSSSTEDVQPCCSLDLKEEPERMTQKNDSESETEAGPNESSLLRNAGVMSRKYNLELRIPGMLIIKLKMKFYVDTFKLSRRCEYTGVTALSVIVLASAGWLVSV